MDVGSTSSVRAKIPYAYRLRTLIGDERANPINGCRRPCAIAPPMMAIIALGRNALYRGNPD